MNDFIYGFHSVIAVIKNRPSDIESLWVQTERQDKRLQEVIALAKKNQITVTSITKDQLTNFTQQQKHQGVAAKLKQTATASFNENHLAELLYSQPMDFRGGAKRNERRSLHLVNEQANEFCNTPENSLAKSIAKTDRPYKWILALDSIQDPHNLGACLRTADAAGVDIIIIPKDKACEITPLVKKVACGAAEHVPVVTVTNLSRTLDELKKQGFWIYGLAGEAEKSLYQTNFDNHCVIVLGAEGQGLRRLIKEKCDFLVAIPMQGSVSSLNVSVACGITLFEVLRQRAKT